jgi:predicted nucleic acid-binding protein
MTFLLDVNALLAFGLNAHQFHSRVVRWLGAQQRPIIATCSITELGFVRILSQVSAFGIAFPEATHLLLTLKRAQNTRISFLPDTHDISHLPNWVKTSKQTTDGHLLALAAAHGALLATFDEKIPGAFLIP